MSKRRSRRASSPQDGVLPHSRLDSEEGMQTLRGLLPPPGSRGFVATRPANFPPSAGEDETILFLSFVRAGLVPPFSEFLFSILEDYGVQLLHLAPNSIVMLAVFAHLCEMFVGVMPSVALWRRYFALRFAGRGATEVTGSCSFRLRDGLGEEYIVQETKKKWENWRLDWCYVSMHLTPRLLVPLDFPEVNTRKWEAVAEDDARLQPVVDRIAVLRACGLTAAMVVGDFLRRRLAPLRRRERPAWHYTGPDDITRTVVGAGGELDPAAFKDALVQVMPVSDTAAADLPRADLPLCVNAQRDEIRGSLPTFDAQGIMKGKDQRQEQMSRRLVISGDDDEEDEPAPTGARG